MRCHATCVEIDGTGILISGRPGSGKSDLALRLIDRGGMLVSDDYTELSAENGRLVARPPAAIAGKFEVRGLGVVDMSYRDQCAVGLSVHLVEQGDEIERLPDPESTTLEGISIPVLRLAAFESSAPAKVAIALRHLAAPGTN